MGVAFDVSIPSRNGGTYRRNDRGRRRHRRSICFHSSQTLLPA